mmetsp:Transcript_25719/g.66231  ORF Transcript_25719/g.66231 Transcript_25719/m.66231 type:complete len:233 (-) Transcript_25719:174-872(-)
MRLLLLLLLLLLMLLIIGPLLLLRCSRVKLCTQLLQLLLALPHLMRVIMLLPWLRLLLRLVSLHACPLLTSPMLDHSSRAPYARNADTCPATCICTGSNPSTTCCVCTHTHLLCHPDLPQPCHAISDPMQEGRMVQSSPPASLNVPKRIYLPIVILLCCSALPRLCLSFIHLHVCICIQCLLYGEVHIHSTPAACQGVQAELVHRTLLFRPAGALLPLLPQPLLVHDALLGL